MYDVITVGSATVDVFVKTEAELIEITKKGSEEELIAYPTGSKILIQQLDFKIGGGGTNTAVAFARLGLKTAYLG
jgi:ribokinase